MLISNYAIKFRVAVMVFIVVIISFGVFSYSSLPREGPPDPAISSPPRRVPLREPVGPDGIGQGARYVGLADQFVERLGSPFAGQDLVHRASSPAPLTVTMPS